MESSIIFTVMSNTYDVREEIKIRNKSTNFTISYTKNSITWITDKNFEGIFTYMSDLLNLLPLSVVGFVYIEIPGFPHLEINVHDLDEKVSSGILNRMSEYMLNRWSSFKR